MIDYQIALVNQMFVVNELTFFDKHSIDYRCRPSCRIQKGSLSFVEFLVLIIRRIHINLSRPIIFRNRLKVSTISEI